MNHPLAAAAPRKDAIVMIDDVGSDTVRSKSCSISSRKPTQRMCCARRVVVCGRGRKEAFTAPKPSSSGNLQERRASATV